jgi:histidine ammonia-lyase
MSSELTPNATSVPAPPTPENAMPSTLQLDGSALTAHQVEAVANGDTTVALESNARQRVATCRTHLERAAERGATHYGINTGFGKFSRQRVEASELRELQANLIRSHAAGVGDPLPRKIVRSMIVILAASLTRARSGVRPELVESLIAMLNAGLTPVVPESGSVGASGDLAPLAHVALALIGEGEVFDAEGVPHAGRRCAQ